MSRWEDDWRYGHPDWTLITDETGTRFVERPQRRRRRKPRALRFAGVKVGDILIQHRKSVSLRYIKAAPGTANDPGEEIRTSIHTSLAIVTDLWFDPVLGQEDPITGQMVGLRFWLGEPRGSKFSHHLRGLATQKWNYATAEEIEAARAEAERVRRLHDAVRSGEVAVLRRRR